MRTRPSCALLFVAALTLSLAAPRQSHAAWPHGPGIYLPVCTAAGSQEYPAVVSPASPAVSADPADTNWDDRFTLPNGVDDRATDEAVLAIATDGRGNVYIGGSFSVAGGVRANNVAKWDGTHWSALGSGTYGSVSALAVDEDGNVYAGGMISVEIGGTTTYGVARWDGTTWSALGEGMDRHDMVAALVVDASGNLYVGGDFVTAGGISASYVAKWDGSTWSALGSGIEANSAIPVQALAVDAEGNLLVGGVFDSAGGVSARNIARWDGSTWSALGSGFTSAIRTLVVDPAGSLYAGGAFSTAGGVSAYRVAKWDGTSWTALGSGTDLNVWALAVDGAGVLYAGGALTRAGGVSANHIARWDGSAWSALGPGVDNRIRTLAVDPAGHLWAGGLFGAAGAVAANHVASWDGSSWSAAGSGSGQGMSSSVWSLASDDAGNMYAAGIFIAAGNVVVNQVARWDGTRWSSLGSGVSGAAFPSSSVGALVTDSARNLYAGGSFSKAGGVSAANVARWDGTSWSALGSGIAGSVSALALDRGGMLYAGGLFTAAGGASAANVARWDGTQWSALGSGIGGSLGSAVFALAADGFGNLYAGGAFETAGGMPANKVAKWDGSRWTPLGSGMNGFVHALVVDEAGILYAAGYFTTAGGVSVPGVARWDGTRWSALGSGGHANAALALDRAGNLYAGAAKWDGTSWTTLGSGMDDAIQALAFDSSGNLYAGGAFATAGGKVSSHIALWRATHALTVSVRGSGTVSRSPDQSRYSSGSQVQLTASASPGWEFAGWSGDASGSEPSITVTVDRDRSVTATFAVGVAFELQPSALQPDQHNGSRTVEGVLEPPPPFSARDIQVASIRIGGVVSVDAPSEVEFRDRDRDGREELVVRFLRSDLASELPAGKSVPVVVTGIIGDDLFVGHDLAKVKSHGVDARMEVTGDPPAPGLAAPSPNPSRGAVRMRYGLSRAGEVRVDVFDVQGRRVKTLVAGARPAGWHDARWDGTDGAGGKVGPGVYVARYRAEGRLYQQRLVRLP